MTAKDFIEGNGWPKIIATALIASMVPVAVGFIAMGGTMRQVEIDARRLDQHLEQYTPEVYRDYSATKSRLAVCESQAADIQRALTELKEQNKEILKQLNRYHQQR